MKFDLFKKEREAEAEANANAASEDQRPLDDRPFLQKIMPVFATGTGLFSDGYINNVCHKATISLEPIPDWSHADTVRADTKQVIGSVSTVLGRQYGDLYSKSTAKSNVSAIAFAGTVVGQLAFGYLSDRWSRVHSLMLTTVILIVFTALATGSYYHGDAVGMFNMLTAWRFFVSLLSLDWHCWSGGRVVANR